MTQIMQSDNPCVHAMYIATNLVMNAKGAQIETPGEAVIRAKEIGACLRELMSAFEEEYDDDLGLDSDEGHTD